MLNKSGTNLNKVYYVFAERTWYKVGRLYDQCVLFIKSFTIEGH